MSWHCTLYTDWPFNGGAPITDLGPIESGELQCALDGRGHLQLVVQPVYRDLVSQALVIETRMEDGVTYHHRIDVVGNDAMSGGIAITALPPWFDLFGNDLVREVIGSRVVTTFTETGTALEILTRRLLPNRAADRVTWFDLGDIDFSDIITVTFDRDTRASASLKVLDALKRGEMRLRSTNDAALLDIVEEIGSELPIVPARFGDRLRKRILTTTFGAMHTAARVYGETPPGESNAHGIDDNAFRVASVTGTGPWQVALVDVTTGLSPIVRDGMFALDPNALVEQCAIETPNGTVLPIVASSAATGSVTVASSPPAAEDRVRICALDGGPLQRIVWPAAVAAHRLVVADAKVPGGRSERNYVRNPAFREGSTEWTASGTNAIVVPVPRERVDLFGELAVTKPASGSPEIVVRAFGGPVTIDRGDDLVVDGAVIAGDATGAVIDDDGLATVPLASPLADTIPAATSLKTVGSSDLTYNVSAHGAGNTAGATNLTVSTYQRSKLFAAGDQLQIVVTTHLDRTMTGVYVIMQSGGTGGTQFLASVDLATGLPVSLAQWTPVQWFDAPAGVWRPAALSTAYTAGATSMNLQFAQIPPTGATLRYSQQQVSAHDVTNSPVWGVNKQASVEIDPPLPAAAPTATTVIYWTRSDDSYVAALVLAAPAVALDDTITVDGTGHVFVVAPNTDFVLNGSTLVCRNTVTLDALGEGTVQCPLPSQTLLEGAAIHVRRNHDWHALDGGSGNVAFINAPQLDITSDEPTVADPHVRTATRTIIVPPGETRTIAARLAATFVAFNPVRTAQQYGHAKLAIVNVDTNAVIAHVITTPDDVTDEMTDPDRARLLLERDEVAGMWLPLHFSLRCDAVLTETTRVQIRLYNYASALGLGDLSYAMLYARYVTLWKQLGTEEALPFAEDGYHGNRMILAGAQLIARDAEPSVAHEIELEDVDAAHAAAVGLPPEAFPAVDVGTRILLEDDSVELRTLSFTRRPGRKQSQITVGRRRPDAAFTLANIAVVSSVGGTR